MKACIYARKSTNKIGQSETIDNQIKICKQRSKEFGLDIVDIKIDVGSGTDDINRPEIKALINDAVAGKYQCVIMKGVSRFFRDTEKGLSLIKKLDVYGIRVITIEENFDSHAQDVRTGTDKLDTSRITMYLMFAEMESKKTADRVKFQQLEKARSGQWNSSRPPFGYSINKETKKLTPIFLEAEVIKMIFQLYEEGMGIRVLANYLNGQNEQGKKFLSPSSKWKSDTVSYILKNRSYVGDILYNVRSRKENIYKNNHHLNYDKEKDTWMGNSYNEEKDWIIAEDSHEAIISREQFFRVQKILETKTNNKGIRGNFSLFAGLIKCGSCGSSMIFRNRNKKDKIYMCKQNVKLGSHACSSHFIHLEILEKSLVDYVEHFISNEKLIIKASATVAENESGLVDSTKEVEAIEKLLKNLSNKMDKLLDKNLNDEITDLQFRMMNQKYSEELDTLTNKLAKLKEKEAASVSETALEKEYRFNQLKTIKLYNGWDIEQKRIYWLQNIEHVTVTPREGKAPSVKWQLKFTLPQ